MIYIISGEINQGKTRKIESLYRRQAQGAGFISRKILDGSTIQGYEIADLVTGQHKTLALKVDLLPEGWDETARCGIFSFSARAIAFAEAVVEEAILNGSAPIFIDEIGPLELKNQGFAPLLKKVLHTGKDLYFTARRSCVQDIRTFFQIDDYELIYLEEGEEEDSTAGR